MKKKAIALLAVCVLLGVCTGCKDSNSKSSSDVTTSETSEVSVSSEATLQDTTEATTEATTAATQGADGVDVDLTAMSSTLVYAEVYNMMAVPDDYKGKTIRMRGTFAVTESTQTGQRYFACIIQDATACCSQGIEFELSGDPTYPDDYPTADTEITVEGTFDTYFEGEFEYCTLRQAKIVE